MVPFSLLFDANFSDSWELNLPSLESNNSIKSETVTNSLPLEAWKAYFLSCLQSSIEVLECSVKVSQGLLWCTLGTLIHPGELNLFQTV